MQPEKSFVRIRLHEHPRPVLIFLTHCHIDHVLDASFIISSERIPLSGSPFIVTAPVP
jgi:glyoxylase-like metal-dependent hydrolase (beta-lactamase superfamily II)